MTGIELLIVIAILGILMSFILPSFLAFRRYSALNTTTEEIVTVINKARLSTISSKGDNQFGVHFQADKVVLFTGTTYTAGAVGNEESVLDPMLTLAAITLAGGGADVIFQKITGDTDQNGTMSLRVVAAPTASSTITIKPTGVVRIN